MASRKRISVTDKGVGKTRGRRGRMAKSILTVHKEIARAELREQARRERYARVQELLGDRYGAKADSTSQ